jgi:hypothetical protein
MWKMLSCLSQYLPRVWVVKIVPIEQDEHLEMSGGDVAFGVDNEECGSKIHIW